MPAVRLHGLSGWTPGANPCMLPAASMQNRAALSALAALAVLALSTSGCEPEAIGPTSEFQGVVEFEDHTLAFEVPGKLVLVSVTEGDVLHPGQELARLDDKLERLNRSALEAQGRATKAQLKLLYAGTRPEVLSQVRARLRAARAATAFAKDQYARTRVLREHDVVAQNALDTAKNAVDQAEASQAQVEQQLAELRKGPRSQEIEAAEARLDAALAQVESSEERVRRHVLYSDMPAEVLDVPVKRGEYVSPGTAIATVADTEHPYVDVFVPQAKIGRFGVGAKLAVHVDTYQEAFGGRVEYVSPSTEFTPRFLFSPRSRPNLVVRARVRIHDPAHRLRAGIPAFVELDPKLPKTAFPELSELASASASGAQPPLASALPSASAPPPSSSK